MFFVEKARLKLYDIEFSNDFLSITPDTSNAKKVDIGFDQNEKLLCVKFGICALAT